MTDALRIATRKSRLALWQAQHVAAQLRDAQPGLEVSLVPITTQGDRILDKTLAKVGGKGLFIKELEIALEEGEADIAVHSMKDVPAELPAGMCIAAVLERADPRDVFVSNRFASLGELPPGAPLGTSSLRRQCQLKHARPDLEILPLRGNVDTRLQRLDEDRFVAIVLAAAGLVRLGLDGRATMYLDEQVCLPAVGQGIIGIECRDDDATSRGLLERLEHDPTRQRLAAERGFAHRLEGSCQSPVAGFAELAGARLRLRGLVGMPDGSRIVSGELSGPRESAAELGIELAESLLGRGADAILAQLRVNV